MPFFTLSVTFLLQRTWPGKISQSWNALHSSNQKDKCTLSTTTLKTRCECFELCHWPSLGMVALLQRFLYISSTCSCGKFQPSKAMTVENEGILAITR